MNPNLEKQLQKEITEHKIVVYMKGTAEEPMCGFSAATVRLFKSLNAPIHTVDILTNAELRQGLKEFSNWPTFPQVYIGGQFVGGNDIVHEMHERGELAPMVQKALGK